MTGRRASRRAAAVALAPSLFALFAGAACTAPSESAPGAATVPPPPDLARPAAVEPAPRQHARPTDAPAGRPAPIAVTTLAGGGARRGSLEAGALLATRAVERALVELPSGRGAELGPSGILRAGELDGAHLVLGLGQLAVRARGGAEGGELRVVTPGADVALAPDVEARVAVLPSGRTWVAVLRGEARVRTAEGEARVRARQALLAPPATAAEREGAAGLAPSVGPADGAAADLALEAARVADGRAGVLSFDPGTPEGYEAALVAAARRVAGEQAQGRVLAESYRRALTEAPARAPALQRALRSHGGRVRELRAALVLTWERTCAFADWASVMRPPQERLGSEALRLLGERVRAALEGAGGA